MPLVFGVLTIKYKLISSCSPMDMFPTMNKNIGLTQHQGLLRIWALWLSSAGDTEGGVCSLPHRGRVGAGRAQDCAQPSGSQALQGPQILFLFFNFRHSCLPSANSRPHLERSLEPVCSSRRPPWRGKWGEASEDFKERGSSTHFSQTSPYPASLLPLHHWQLWPLLFLIKTDISFRLWCVRCISSTVGSQSQGDSSQSAVAHSQPGCSPQAFYLRDKVGVSNITVNISLVQRSLDISSRSS